MREQMIDAWQRVKGRRGATSVLRSQRFQRLFINEPSVGLLTETWTVRATHCAVLPEPPNGDSRERTCEYSVVFSPVLSSALSLGELLVQFRIRGLPSF